MMWLRVDEREKAAQANRADCPRTSRRLATGQEAESIRGGGERGKILNAAS